MFALKEHVYCRGLVSRPVYLPESAILLDQTQAHYQMDRPSASPLPSRWSLLLDAEVLHALERESTPRRVV